MTELIYIHNCSRKYCIDTINKIRSKYTEIEQKINSNSNYKIPDYLESEILNDSIILDIWDNILICLESYDIEAYFLATSPKEVIKDIYKEVTIDYKKYNPKLKDKINALCKNELNKLDNFINTINTNENNFNNSHLFYRRVLSKNEYYTKKNLLLNKIEKFNCCKSIKKDQFEIKYLEKIYKKIQDEYKNERIYEINLSDYSYTFDVSALNFNSTRGFNTYWFNSEIDWIIEKNHEGWYNLYGSWLENNIPELKYYKDY